MKKYSRYVKYKKRIEENILKKSGENAVSGEN